MNEIEDVIDWIVLAVTVVLLIADAAFIVIAAIGGLRVTLLSFIFSGIALALNLYMMLE